MKLRIRGDSLRLRLTRAEVTTFAKEGYVEDAVAFPGGARLLYALARSAEGAAVEASLVSSRVLVTLPAELARAWAETDQIGVDAEVRGGAGPLRVLVEKDFACLKPRAGEDDAGAYPHPLAGAGEGGASGA